MSISKELDNRVKEKVTECIAKILGAERAAKFHFPVTYHSNMNRVAGLAYMTEMRIELNEPLFLANIEQFFARTIPHEVAHLIQTIVYPKAKQSHGPEWRHIMELLGAESKRSHSYDVSICTTMERFRYVCNCTNRSFSVTKILHNKMQKGQKRFCNTCTGRAVYWPIGDSN